MKTLKKAVLMAELMERMRKNGSWCGETHIQKAVYFLQVLMKVPTGYEFTLYKHGPFSFDLRDEITDWRVSQLFRLEPRPAPYGSSLGTTSNLESVKERYPKTLSKYRKHIDFVADLVGDRGVAVLERLATALYVTVRIPKSNAEIRAQRINELKPHVQLNLALEAIREIDTISLTAKEFLKNLS